ncbi:12646_t:CDS:2 [Rhizophagus irregularis]|nr:12646_t:CDS:2 [Rhizophagus irregularis]
MSLRQPQQVPAAFEIRFSTTDSILEVVEIQPDQSAQSVPDPFKKRDKIPRSSGSIEQFRISTNSDQVLKVKSSNAVGPEADKQQRVNGIGKNERSNSLGNDMFINSNSTERKNTLDDDLIIRNPNNKKQRSKFDEISSEKEKSKVIPNHQIMDLNGKADMVSSNNIKKIPSKTIPPPSSKNKLIMSTNTIDDNKSLQKDENDQSLITPPPSSSSDSTSTEFIDDYKSSSSRVSRPSKISQSSKKRRGSHSPQKSQSMLSTKRSIEMNAYQPPKKLQQPRGRRSYSVSGQVVTSEQPLDSNKSKEIKKSKQSPSPTTRSRIPRLSISSRERPTIAQKISQGSLSSQGSNKFNESKELLESYPLVNSKIEPPRNIRLSPSRPIINTALITDVEVGSESPTGRSPINHSSSSHSPTNHSPTNHSPTNHLPLNHSSSNHSIHQKKFISYDDVVIPTIAKKLKMNGQLPYVNHDALLGYSDEPEDLTPTSENGYMDITDQVVNLFDGPQIKSHKRQSSGPDSQHRRQRKNSSSGHSRNASKTHYIAPRKQPPQQTQSHEDVPSPTNSQFENSFDHHAPHDNQIRSKRGRSRREEYIISVREDDDIDLFIEPPPSMPLVLSEPSIVPTVQVEINDQIYQEKPSPVQIPVQIPVQTPVQIPVQTSVQIPVMQEIEYKTISTEVDSVPTVTSGKKKTGRKKQKKSDGGNLDDDDYVRKSKCRCAIM